MRYLAMIVLLPALALAGPTYVTTWPDRVTVAGGVTFQPSPAQCRAAGYELLANKPGPTAAEIAAAQAAAEDMATAQSNQTAKAQAMLDTYHATTRDLCALAGVTAPTTNEMTAAQLDAVCFPLLDDAKDNDKIKRNIKIIGMALKLENLSRALEREGINVTR